MKLISKLLGYLHSGFDRTPQSFVAFRARHTSDSFNYVVTDNVLTGLIGNVVLFQVDLTQYTLGALANFIATQPGMTVPFVAGSDLLGVSAVTLLDAESSQIQSNGDCFVAYTSQLWSWLNTMIIELVELRSQVVQMLNQMSIQTAQEDWLDEWGGYFGIPRNLGELDAVYSQRIVIEVLRPKHNNKAIELALQNLFGQKAKVIDVTKYASVLSPYNGSFNHDGSHKYSDSSVPVYGMFAVEIAYSLESDFDEQGYSQKIHDFIEKFRAAGTHMDSLLLGGSILSDAYPTQNTNDLLTVIPAVSLADVNQPPVEVSMASKIGISTVTESYSGASDGLFLTININSSYSGQRIYNSAKLYNAGTYTEQWTN